MVPICKTGCELSADSSVQSSKDLNCFGYVQNSFPVE